MMMEKQKKTDVNNELKTAKNRKAEIDITYS